MAASSMYLSVVWACCCLGMALIAVPAFALGVAATNARRSGLASGAFVFAWGITAVFVPVLALMRGFNWATALLVCGVAPAALWLFRHRGDRRPAFTRMVRGTVLRAVAARADRVWMRRVAIGCVCALLAASALLAAAISTGLRLAVPADFDTLWRTRQLLSGSVSWDPLAALSAVTARIAAVDALVAVIAVRICLIAATVVAAGLAAAQVFGRRSVAATVAVPFAFTVPVISLDLWAVALLAIIAVGALVSQRETGDVESRGVWCALAAGVLASAHLAHCATPQLMWTQVRQTASLEHSAAARETLRLAHASPTDDWLLIGPPEQALELEGRGRFLDLAQFVSRFENLADRPDFRFNLPARRLYVMVEKQTLNVSRPVVGVRFIDSQPPVYRVQSERDRLEHAARRLCDRYRRTHSGSAIAYDDVALRIYQFEL